MAEGKSISGATPDEARAINRFFWLSTGMGFRVAVAAHYFIWNWVPWYRTLIANFQEKFYVANLDGYGSPQGDHRRRYCCRFDRSDESLRAIEHQVFVLARRSR